MKTREQYASDFQFYIECFEKKMESPNEKSFRWKFNFEEEGQKEKFSALLDYFEQHEDQYAVSAEKRFDRGEIFVQAIYFPYDEFYLNQRLSKHFEFRTRFEEVHPGRARFFNEKEARKNHILTLLGAKVSKGSSEITLRSKEVIEGFLDASIEEIENCWTHWKTFHVALDLFVEQNLITKEEAHKKRLAVMAPLGLYKESA